MSGFRNIKKYNRLDKVEYLIRLGSRYRQRFALKFGLHPGFS